MKENQVLLKCGCHQDWEHKSHSSLVVCKMLYKSAYETNQTQAKLKTQRHAVVATVSAPGPSVLTGGRVRPCRHRMPSHEGPLPSAGLETLWSFVFRHIGGKYIFCFCLQNTILGACRVKSEWLETHVEASISELVEQKQQLEDIVTPIFIKMATPRELWIKSSLNVRKDEYWVLCCYSEIL